jgi:hypothetical protein
MTQLCVIVFKQRRMNYEDLNKDESIKLMVKYFSDKYGDGNFKIQHLKIKTINAQHKI